MKSEMPYLGVAIPKVRAVTKAAARKHPPTPVAHLGATAATLWRGATHREHRYAATEVRALLLAWSSAPNRWLRRAAIIAQLGLKGLTDVDLLSQVIDANASHRDFFVRKAIGWALRDYARTDPEWVRAFVEDRAGALASLSCREATRHLP